MADEPLEPEKADDASERVDELEDRVADIEEEDRLRDIEARIEALQSLESC